MYLCRNTNRTVCRWRKSAKKLKSITRMNLVQFRCLSTETGEASERSAIPQSSTSPTSADVIVCGGGVIGLSTAYHLALLGVQNVMLLEQEEIGEKSRRQTMRYTSPHHLWEDRQMLPIAQYSGQLYKTLTAKYPDIGYLQCGSLFVAHSESTFHSLRRVECLAKALSYGAKLMSPSEAVEQVAALSLNTDDITGGIWFPDDAKASTGALCQALAAEAINLGVKIFPRTKVNTILIGHNRDVYGVETDLGFIRCKKFVDTSGLWAGTIPLKGYPEDRPPKLPMQPCSYQYMTATSPVEFQGEMPYVIDLDGQVYMTGSNGEFMGGGCVIEAMQPEFIHQPAPRHFSQERIKRDWDRFYPVLENLVKRFPLLKDAKVESLVTQVDCYTPDAYMILGALPQIKGYYVGTGMNGLGTSVAGGVGRLLAEWTWKNNYLLSQDVSKIDVSRLLDAHSNVNYLKERAPEVAGLIFRPLYYSHQCKTARNLRKSPIFHLLAARGAVFGECMGYERPLYFKPDSSSRQNDVGRSEHDHLDVYQESLMEKPGWFNYVESEYQACRERVAVIDMTHFSKFDILSEDEKDVVNFLQRLCSANVDKPVGTTIYTGMQNDNGGYVTDCTLSRLSNNHYFMIAPTVQQVRVKMWMERHIPEHSGVVVQDVTSTYTALNVLGPLSRHLLQDLTDVSMSPTDFPAFHCKDLDVGFASGVRAISVSHCGELGWVLYIPNEFAEHVYEDIVKAGKNYGLQHAGYLTLRHLRIEKFYVYWGMDIDLTTTPMECGRLFRVDLKVGCNKRYVQLLLDKHHMHTDPWPQGQEPIYRNGKFSGMTTTASYGFTLGCQVCLGFVENIGEDGTRDVVSPEFVTDPSAVYEVVVAGQRFPARVNVHSPHLPMISSEQSSHYRPTQ